MSSVSYAPATQTHLAPVRYDRWTIALHWTVFSLVVVLWLLGQLIDATPKPFQPSLWAVHVVLGVLLAVALVVRLTWRLTGGRQLPPTEVGVLKKLAEGVHYLLYGLLGGVVVLGLVTWWWFGTPLFGAVLLSSPGFVDQSLKRSVRGYHGMVANWLAILAGFHAAAALFHHYIKRDGVLRRMIPNLGAR